MSEPAKCPVCAGPVSEYYSNVDKPHDCTPVLLARIKELEGIAEKALRWTRVSRIGDGFPRTPATLEAFTETLEALAEAFPELRDAARGIK